MVVDFGIRKAPEYRLATRTIRGPWPGDKSLRSEYGKLLEWAKKRGIKTGKWFFREFDEDSRQTSKRRWEVGVEIRTKGTVRGAEGVLITTLPSSTVALVTFDPDSVSPRVVYHGLTDWLRMREKEGEYKISGPYREVYLADPWSNRRAWAHTQIQVPVRKLSA